jgi:ribosome biogenesis protein BMS1
VEAKHNTRTEQTFFVLKGGGYLNNHKLTSTLTGDFEQHTLSTIHPYIYTMDDKPHKAHHTSSSGNKAAKKDAVKGVDRTGGKTYNPKAFIGSSFRSADKAARRTADKDERRLHVPLVNRNPEERKVTGQKGKGMDEGALPPPPIVVGIVGPPGVGKSTLLKSLVKRFTKHNLNQPQGPITVVSGKTRRITFVECGNDLNSMIDLGKVVDLVLLMIDGSFGFEMVSHHPLSC